MKIKTAKDNIKYLSVYKVSETDEHENVISKTFFIQDVSEDVLKEQTLAQTVKDNQILLKEVHHRVKNNMQIINSLLNIQSFKIKDDFIKEIIKESQKRIRTMALVHEHLYNYESFDNININTYIGDLINEIKSSYTGKNIKIKTDIIDVYFNLDILIPLGLIINELLINSIKYAFPADGSFNGFGNENTNFGKDAVISIKIFAEDEGYTLIFSDNGIGYSINNINSNDVGIGTELIQSLVMQINGIYTIDSNNGTVITINFRNSF